MVSRKAHLSPRQNGAAGGPLARKRQPGAHAPVVRKRHPGAHAPLAPLRFRAVNVGSFLRQSRNKEPNILRAVAGNSSSRIISTAVKVHLVPGYALVEGVRRCLQATQRSRSLVFLSPSNIESTELYTTTTRVL